MDHSRPKSPVASPLRRPPAEGRSPTPASRDGQVGLFVVVAVFLLVASAIGVAGYVLFEQQKEAVAAAKQQQLTEVAASRTRDIASWRTERIDDAKAVARSESFITVVQQWLAKDELSAPARRYITDELDSRLIAPRYDGVFLLAPSGAMRVSVGALPDERALAGFVARVRRMQSVVFGDVVDKRLPTGPVRLFMLVPLYAPAPDTGLIGILGYRINPYPYFLSVVTAGARPGPTTELLLVRRADNTILLSDQAREVAVGGRAPALRLPPSVIQAPGGIQGRDYRGKEVFAVVDPVPGTPWSVIAKMDQSDILAPIREFAIWITGAAMLIVVVAGTLILVWWRKERLENRMRRYEDALRQRALSEHFDYLAKYANDIILLTDDRGRIIEANDRAVEAYGLPRDRLLGTAWDELVSEPGEGGFSIRWQDTKRTNAVVYETRHKRTDGTVFPVEISARIIETDGRPFFQAIIRDITERKEAETRLVRANRLYAALSQTNEAIVRLRDRDALFSEVCRIAVDTVGLKVAWIGAVQADLPFLAPVAYAGDVPEALKSGPTIATVPDLPQGRGPTGRAVRERKPEVSNDFLNDPTTAVWHERAAKGGIRSSAALPLMCNEEVVGALSLFSDEKGYFTDEVLELFREMALDLSYALENIDREAERRRAERSVRESEERFRQLFDNMSSGVAVYEAVDDGTRFIFADANRALERIEQVERKDIIGREVRDVFPAAERFGLVDVLRRVYRSGKPEQLDASLYDDGRIRGWRENYVYRLPEGRHVVAMHDDVTKRKEAEEALRANEERLSLVFEGSNDGFWDHDFARNEVYYSPRWYDMLGYEEGDIPARPDSWRLLVHPDDLPDVTRVIDRHFRGETDHYQAEYRMRTKSGKWRWVLARGRVVSRDANGRPLRMTGTHTDITERRRAEEEVRLWAKVFENSGEAIFITDADRKIVSANRAFYETTGYTSEEVIGNDPSVLRSHHHDRDFYQNMWASINDLGHWQGEIWDRRKGGESYPQWLAITAVKDRYGNVANYIAIFSDISERKEAEERIRYLAHHDFLTGLPNRTLLHERLEHEVAHAKRKGSRLAVLFIDLDRFKNVNDSLGHHRGDQLLREVAVRLVKCVREDDTVSRQGGDEFVVALTEIADADDAAHAARKVVEELSRPYRLDEYEVHMTPSIGISLYPDDGEDIDTLMRNADAAMYYAKEKGRNNFQFFVAELNRRAFERLSLETNLRRGLDEGELRLVYQPQLDARTGEVTGVEALVRWQPDGGEVLLPNDFIPVAEESGLITLLGEWVLREACRQHKVWLDAGLKRIPVSVNISAIQFHQKDFLASVERIITETGIDPHCVEFELTEGSVMQEAENTVRTLSDLKGMGIALAIDDFGTGYSSLSYLRRFPLDRLKVDQSFIRDMTYDSADLEITSAIIALGRILGLRVIAEGVETEQELQLLRQRRCDEIQGNYFSGPLPPDELPGWIAMQGAGRRSHVQ